MNYSSPFVIAMALLLSPALSWAQAAPELGVVTTLQGQASVARASVSGSLPLKFKDAVFDRDRIQTGEESIVKVLMGGKAIVTVRELSVLTITEELGKTTINLTSGKIAVGVAKQRMKPGEQLEVHTPNAVAAVRGTVFVVEVTRQGAQGTGGPLGAHTQITCVNGAVDVAPRANLSQSTQLTATRSVGLLGAILGPTQTLNVQQLGRLVGSFAATLPSNHHGRDNFIRQETNKVIALAAALAPEGPETGTEQQGGCTTGCKAPIIPTITLPPVGKVAGNLLQNPGFETGTLEGWTPSGAAAVIQNIGSITARNGQFMAIINTGPRAIGHKTSRLAQSGLGGSGSLYNVTISYNFMSNEWPTPRLFNDAFVATVTDRNGVTTQVAREERDTAVFQPTPSTISAGSFTLAEGNGIVGWKTVSKMVAATGGGLEQLAFEISGSGDTAFDTATLLDSAVVEVDPPLYFLQGGAKLVKTGIDPLLDYRGGKETFDSAMVIAAGSSASLSGPLLRADGTDLTVAFSLLSVLPGGRFTSSTTEPLVSITGGTHALGTSVAIFDLAGSGTTIDPQTGQTVATDTPLTTGGGLLAADGATITTQQALRVDAALLEASAPLLVLTRGSQLTSASDAIALGGQSRLTSRGSTLVALEASRLVISRGALVNVAGGSGLLVVGNLVTLSNGSTLSLLNGPLLSVSGGSFASIGGALVAFGGSGGNLLSVSNTLCGGSCALISGIPVALLNGATAANVSIADGALKNPALGAIKYATPTTALVSLSGAGSKVTVGGK